LLCDFFFPDVLTDKRWDYPHETPVLFSEKSGHFPGTLETPTTTELGKNATKKTRPWPNTTSLRFRKNVWCFISTALLLGLNALLLRKMHSM